MFFVLFGEIMIKNHTEVNYKSKYFQSLHGSSLWNGRNIVVGAATLSLTGVTFYVLAQKGMFSFFSPKELAGQGGKVANVVSDTHTPKLALPVCLLTEKPLDAIELYPQLNITENSIKAAGTFAKSFPGVQDAFIEPSKGLNPFMRSIMRSKFRTPPSHHHDILSTKITIELTPNDSNAVKGKISVIPGKTNKGIDLSLRTKPVTNLAQFSKEFFSLMIPFILVQFAALEGMFGRK